jgi:hypothetical protein
MPRTAMLQPGHKTLQRAASLADQIPVRPGAAITGIDGCNMTLTSYY